MSCKETDEVDEDRDREAGRSPSEQTVLTEVQEDEAPRSPDDIILPTIPVRDERDRGRLAAGTQDTRDQPLRRVANMHKIQLAKTCRGR